MINKTPNNLIVSLIIIHYHTQDLLIGLLESFHETTDCNLHQYEIIVVNNGGELEKIKSLDHPVSTFFLDPADNLGYAGGINLGVSHAKGDIFILMNADLVLHHGSILSIVQTLASEDIVGPQFYWDQNCQIKLPPTEPIDLQYILTRGLAKKYSIFYKRLQGVYHRHVNLHLKANSPIESIHLSGALLGVRRATWNKVGPFDDNFRLYFEELDWLLRAKKLGLSSVLQPQAKVTHYYNQSASHNSMSQKWFHQSLSYFNKKHHPQIYLILKNWIDRMTAGVRDPESQKVWTRRKLETEQPFKPIQIKSSGNRDDLVLQISVFESFVPAAFVSLDTSESDTSWVLPDEIWSRLLVGPYYFRVVDHKGKNIIP